jgi:hypothetical protein
MGAITGTLALGTGMTGASYKICVITATVASASDTITLTAATHGITAITGIVGAVITGGQDAAFTAIGVSFSGLVLTVTSVEQDGTASTDWTGTTVSITVIGTV